MLVVRRILREARERPREGIDFGCTYTLTRTRDAVPAELLPKSNQLLNLDIPAHILTVTPVTASADTGKCFHTCSANRKMSVRVRCSARAISITSYYISDHPKWQSLLKYQ